MADETIRVTAESKEAQIAFLQLRDVVQEFLTKLGLIGPAAEKYGQILTESFAEAGLSAKQMAEELPKVGGTITSNFRTAVESSGSAIKDWTKSIAGGIGVVQILKANLNDLEPVLERNKQLLIEGAEALGIEGAQVAALTRYLERSLDPRKIIKTILEDTAEGSKRLAEAWVGESTALANLTEEQIKNTNAYRDQLKVAKDRDASIQREQQSMANLAEVLARTANKELRENGEVSKRTADEIYNLNQKYADLGEEAPQKFQAIVFGLEILTSEQEKNLASAQKLADESSKAAAKRAEAEEAASKRAIEALQKEEAEREKAAAKRIADAEKNIADLEEQAERRRKAATDEGDPQIDATAQSVSTLKDEISALENKPIISPEEQNRLDSAKNSLADLNRTMQDYGRTVQYVADNHLLESEAFDQSQAQWELGIELSKQAYDAQTKLLASQDDGIDSVSDLTDANKKLDDILGDNVGTFQDLSKEADRTGDKLGDVADETKKINDESKKLEESDPLAKLKAGAEEALPVAVQLRDVLKEIVALGAAADI